MANASSSTAKNTAPVVTKDMRVLDIITLCPAAADIMAEYGLHCFSCAMGGLESLEEGCQMHDFPEETIDALIEDLNEALAEQPARPAEITITDEAAVALGDIAKTEGHTGEYLAVTLDEQGGFCMEFQKEKAKGDHIFTNPQTPELEFLASPITLWRIGGATIDFREGRFKLDLVDECCNGEATGCACTSDCS